MSHAPSKVRFWLTTPDQKSLLAPQPTQQWHSSASTSLVGSTVIEVDERVGYQTMDGFGAALTDSSAWLLMRSMSASAREALLKSLFSPQQKEGIGFSVLRLPMGASDFAVNGSYTYNDMPSGQTDPKLEQFSIAHDLEYIIPLLRRIRQINPKLKIIASPWSAPAWMKTSRKLNGGWLEWSAYSAYAQYFIKFIQAYSRAGVPIHAITVQNEPRLERDSYPTMRMEPRDQMRFIKDHLGPALSKARLKTKIFCWDHNWDAPEFPLEVLGDPEARRFIAGTAFHGYAGDVSAQSKVMRAYPDKELHFTESSGGEWAKDFGGNMQWDIKKLIVGATRNGAKSVLKWNLLLDSNHGPQNGGCTDCRGIVTLDRRTGTVTQNCEYYAFGHASRFVRPGARRIASSESSDIPNVAFKNKDGSSVLVACNVTSVKRSFVVRNGGKSLALSLYPGETTTLCWYSA